MTDLAELILAAMAGVALGAMFFGGLWWTVQRARTSEWPATLFISSIIVRMGLTLGGIWLVFGGDWPRLVACLVGFTVARWGAARLIGQASAPSSPEVRHAPES